MDAVTPWKHLAEHKDQRVVMLVSEDPNASLQAEYPGFEVERPVGDPGAADLGHSMSGAVRVVIDDGRTLDIGPDTVFDIPPGHDQWVIGDEPWVAIEWGASGRALGAAVHEAGSRSLATVLFTDIVDSTAKLEAVGDAAWRSLLADHNARLREHSAGAR
jgi:hypothetical protein